MKSKDDFVASINKKEPSGLKPGGSSFRVLVVDDSATMRKIIIQMLKSELYDICGEASDGAIAIEKYKELKPDVVTLDINMPNVTGVEVLNKIIAFDPAAKIVMLTSEGQKQTVIDAIKMGAKNYVVKPPERKDLIDKLEQVLK
jgi:two-component system, chemotaxis family, chemotaxis protein CheY